jgi:hypothetical protein
VEGRILPDGTRIADSSGNPAATQRLLTMTAGCKGGRRAMQIGGLTIPFGQTSGCRGPIDSIVRVTLGSVGGNWEGQKVEVLEDPAQEASPADRNPICRAPNRAAFSRVAASPVAWRRVERRW